MLVVCLHAALHVKHEGGCNKYQEWIETKIQEDSTYLLIHDKLSFRTKYESKKIIIIILIKFFPLIPILNIYTLDFLSILPANCPVTEQAKVLWPARNCFLSGCLFFCCFCFCNFVSNSTIEYHVGKKLIQNSDFARHNEWYTKVIIKQ